MPANYLVKNNDFGYIYHTDNEIVSKGITWLKSTDFTLYLYYRYTKSLKQNLKFGDKFLKSFYVYTKFLTIVSHQTVIGNVPHLT